MTGMTKDYAIAILRRMQEPEPFEPQINESAFDALEMAIEAIQKYATWSQTYSNMVEDVISRKAAVDAIHRYFGKRIEQSPMHKTEDGEVYDLGICNPLLEDNKALSQAIKELPSAQPEPDTALYVEGFNDGYKQGKSDAQSNVARDIATIIENEKDMRVILEQPDNRLVKIIDLMHGTIEHFDYEDAMDLLYQIKDVLNG